MALLQNPFAFTTAPETMTEERHLRQRHIAGTVLLSIIGVLFGIYLTPLVIYIWAHNLTFNADTIHLIKRYMLLLTSSDPWSAHTHMYRDNTFIPGEVHIIPHGNDHLFKVAMSYIIVTMVFLFACLSRNLTNTSKRMVMTQDAQWMDNHILHMMEKRKQVGIRGAKVMALGLWKYGLRAGMPVRMIETLSALCLAPPGTGKTAGIIIPTIITCDHVSQIINDSKPELYEMTGAYRQKISITHMLHWSKIDSHEILVDDRGVAIRDANNRFQYKHTIYSRYNPLCRAMVPPPGATRDTYLETVGGIIIPRDEKKKTDYFPDQGRDALVGFLHVAVAKIYDSTDPNRWKEFGPEWHGKEVSLPMIIDWYSRSQFTATQAKTDENGKPVQQEADPLGSWLRSICDSVNPDTNRDENGPKPGTTQRGFSSLSVLVNMADKERSGVLGTLGQGLAPFRNTAVRERMESSDFSPDDLRGVWDPIDRKMKPFTLYICVNQQEAENFSMISSLLYETMSLFLLSFGPNEVNPTTGKRLGPYPVVFALDEFAKLKKIPSVIAGPDLGRSKQVSYLIVAQTLPQIRMTYSEDHGKMIQATTSVQIVLEQNDTETVDNIIKKVGKTTIRVGKISYREGAHKNADIFSWNRSEDIKETDLLRRKDVMQMDPGTHILIVQSFGTNPIKVDTMLYFKDPEMVKNVNYKGSGTSPKINVPQHIYDAKIAEWTANNGMQKLRKLYQARHAKRLTEEAEKKHSQSLDYSDAMQY